MSSSKKELKCSLKEFRVNVFLLNSSYHKEIHDRNKKYVSDTPVRSQYAIFSEHLRNLSKFSFFLEEVISTILTFVMGGPSLPDLYKMEATCNKLLHITITTCYYVEYLLKTFCSTYAEMHYRVFVHLYVHVDVLTGDFIG